MDQHQETSLFDMNMDANTQTYLQSISKWSRFISITGFVMGGLFLLLFAAYGRQILSAFAILASAGDGETAGIIIAIIIVGSVLVGCWLFFLFRSSKLINQGLTSKDSILISEGFKSMRIYFIISFIISVLTILSSLSTMTQ